MRLVDLSYEEWLEHAFGREVRLRGNPWFFDLDCPWWDPPAEAALTYLARLFEQPEPALAHFADSQISQGLTYLLDTSASGDNGWFYSTVVPRQDRLRAVEAIGDFFEKLFLPRCSPILSHLDESEANPLNRNCYMWWDVFPSLALPRDPDRAALHDAALATMQRILALNSVACRESALHGLGHWQREYPRQVERIVDQLLELKGRIDPRLIDYAQAARCGCVL